MLDKNSLTVEVYRFDPDTKPEPYTQTYTIPWGSDEDAMVLDVLAPTQREG